MKGIVLSPENQSLVTRPTRAEVDLEAIAANVALAIGMVGPATQVMAVVKANAYGHGAVPVARVVLRAGASWLGVATPEEAIPLRSDGIVAPILVLGPIAPEQADLVAAHGLDQCVSDPTQAEALSRAARARGRILSLHLKVDTGMGRVGLPPGEVQRAADRIRALPCVRLAALMTHFAEAEAEEPAFAREQLHRFSVVAATLRAAGIEPLIRHAANSAALLFLPEARLDLVRPGIMLYGYDPRGRAEAKRRTGAEAQGRGGAGVQGRSGAGAQEQADGGYGTTEPALRRALRFRTAISQLATVPRGASVSYGRTFVAPRDVTVATLPVGYADGWGRLLSNRGQVLIRGRRVQIIGRVCMDMTMVDVTDLRDVRAGDEAVLIGRQGTEEITADEVAELQGTISYEVLCRIGPRVPRVYLPVSDPESPCTA